jgi:hypothetical protein
LASQKAKARKGIAKAYEGIAKAYEGIAKACEGIGLLKGHGMVCVADNDKLGGHHLGFLPSPLSVEDKVNVQVGLLRVWQACLKSGRGLVGTLGKLGSGWLAGGGRCKPYNHTFQTRKSVSSLYLCMLASRMHTIRTQALACTCLNVSGSKLHFTSVICHGVGLLRTDAACHCVLSHDEPCMLQMILTYAR